jgi:GH15 family glucan-1,4-alpha-glucosidase
MCWAGLDRMERLREKGYFKNIDFDLTAARKLAESAVRKAIVEGSVRNGPTDGSFNAALLQLPLLRFPDPVLNEVTVDAIIQELRFSTLETPQYHLYRYKIQDDFGVPQSAFLFCSFWWIQALGKIGRREEAKRSLHRVMEAANSLGLFSEHFVPATGEQRGNFPQAYSHVGQLNAAFAVSLPWDEVL